MKTLLLILLVVATSGAGQLFLKIGVSRSGSHLTSDGFNLSGWLSVISDANVLTGLALWVISTIIYLLVLSRTELSYAYCLGSLNYIFIPLLSYFLFSEDFSPMRIIGAGFIFVGVSFTLISKVL